MLFLRTDSIPTVDKEDGKRGRKGREEREEIGREERERNKCKMQRGRRRNEMEDESKKK